MHESRGENGFADSGVCPCYEETTEHGTTPEKCSNCESQLFARAFSPWENICPRTPPACKSPARRAGRRLAPGGAQATPGVVRSTPTAPPRGARTIRTAVPGGEGRAITFRHSNRDTTNSRAALHRRGKALECRFVKLRVYRN